jgi:hypothetical protein
MNTHEAESKSAKLKIKLLLSGIRIDGTAFEGLGSRYKEYQYGYNDSNWLDKNKQQLLPSELLLPGGIVAAPHLRPGSPYVIKRGENGMFVFDETTEECLSSVDYLPRPKIWDAALDDGTPIKKYLNVYGKDCLNLFIVANCQFWDAGLPCSFCSLQPAQDFHKEAVMYKPVAKIEEAVKKAFASGDELNWMIITGGSLFKRHDEVIRYRDVLNAVQRAIPASWNGKIRGNGAFLPACDEDDLKSLFDTGIEHPSFNLEVWGKELFARHCPGKEKFAGFDTLLETYKLAARIWGAGEVWCNFVGGISPIKNLREGFKYLADLGVVPGSNIFHLDPSVPATKLGLDEPSEDYVYSLYGSLNEIYQTYHFHPFFSASVLRNSLSNEFYNGWI